MKDLRDRGRFTLIFEGDLTKMPHPFKTDTPFGRPIAAGFGDAFVKIDELEAEAVEKIGVRK